MREGPGRATTGHLAKGADGDQIHSGLMPACLMMGHHFEISAF
jgi:hypothetical protein